MEKQQRQQEWTLQLAAQYGQIKVMATRITGATASAGVALGGIAATAVAATMAGFQGVVQGASRVSGGQPALPDLPDVDPPPELCPEHTRPPRVKQATTDIETVAPRRCPRCDGDRRAAHTYDKDTCIGLPKECYFGPRRPAALTGATSSSTPAPPDIVSSTPVGQSPGREAAGPAEDDHAFVTRQQEVALNQPLPNSVPNSFGSATSTDKQCIPTLEETYAICR